MPPENTLHQMIWAATAGIFSQLLSEKIKQPSIFFLLLVGLLMGPHGVGLLRPIEFRDQLPLLVEAAVIVILFEGSLSLQIRQFQKISGVIRSLTTTGAALTMLLCSVSARLLIGIPWGLSLIFGALVSITGPTVIGPILKRVKLKKQVGTALLWEGIILDPIGAIAAVIVLEILLSSRESFVLTPLLNFPIRFGVGLLAGTLVGFLSIRFLRHKGIVSLETRKNLVLALSLFCYGLSEVLFSHSGLVAVVTLGIVFGNSRIHDIESIKEFKGTLTTFLLSVVFVLLAANLNLGAIRSLGWGAVALLVVVLLIARPLDIWISTRGSSLTSREKIYLSWMAPRGIVAAALASLMTIDLVKQSYPRAENLESLVYLVIGSTVVLQGLTAGLTARLLGVSERQKKGFLLVGAHPFAQALGLWLREKGIEVKMIDTDIHDVNEARTKGLDAYKGSILDESFVNGVDLREVGHLLALTTNDEVNVLSCQIGSRLFDAEGCYRLKEPPEVSKFLAESGGESVFDGLPSMDELSVGLRGNIFRLAVLSLEAPLKVETSPVIFKQVSGWPLFHDTEGQSVPVKVGENLKARESVLFLMKDY